jgi:predicted HicB family RNase H-like nuclease
MPAKKRGRPPKDEDRLHSESLLVRLETTEKEAFRDAADLAGVSLSTWVRERLRQVAIRELQSAAQPIAFLKHLTRN